MKATDLEFGFKRDAIEAPAVWGARIILDRNGDEKYWIADLVPDRQDLKADTPEAKAALVAKLDGEPKGEGAIRALLDYLTRGLKQYRVRLDSDKQFDFTLRGVRFRGSPNASGGYFYVTGTLEDTPTCHGCGAGGEHEGTKTYPGLCERCRQERSEEARKAAQKPVRGRRW